MTKAERAIADTPEAEVGGDLCCRKGLRSKNDLDVKEMVIFGPESSAAVKSKLGRCWNECANARNHPRLACRHAEPDWL
jgi:hypothetical protein